MTQNVGPTVETTAAPSARSRWVRPLIGGVGYGAVVLLVWKNVDRTHFLAGMARLTTAHLLVVLLVAMLHIAGRALRFHRLLLRTHPTDYRWTDGVRIFLVGLSASAVTPARAGDLIKAQLVKPYGVGFNAGLGLVLIERMLNLLVIASSIVVTGALLSSQSGSAGWRGATLVLLAGLASVCVVLTVKRVRTPLLRAAAGLLSRVRPSAGSPAKIESVLEGAFTVWDQVFVSPRTLLTYWVSSAAVWTIEFAKLWLVLRFVGIEVAPAVVFFVYPVSIVAGILTMLPFSEGVVGITGVALLGSMAAIDSGAATVAIVIDRAASNVPPLLLWGVFALLRERQAARSRP